MFTCTGEFAGAPLPTIAAPAATYYVAMTGSDSNPGTETQPWRTVAYAVAIMVAGDTTYVRGGTYKEEIIRFGKSGTQLAPIKLRNAPGESPIIDCIDASKLHRILIEHPSGPLNPMGWITVEGFEIRNCYEGIKIISGHDLTIQRNWIHHSKPGSGILGNGTRVLFDRNIINHNANIEGCEAGTSPCRPGGHGIYFHGTAVTVTNNIIYDNLTFGIQLNGSTASSTYNPTTDPGPEYAVSENWLIANNTLAYNRRGAGLVVWGFSCNNARIENNIFYENAATNSDATQGVHFTSTTCTGARIRNNIFYASGSGGVLAFGKGALEWVHYTQSGNIINTMNPRFVNAPATLPAWPNFSLTAGSPAIDAGLSLAITKKAFDGILRPQGCAFDIGAYEYTGGDDARPPDGQRHPEKSCHKLDK
ncbi:right-handed parallel beta-helix repeat-containing protein [Candidatus Nitrospira nitrificans]|nr:right-handed parallel beta-helix repeat-containing protein [Candidatus Nitrospira nitrificans]